MDRPIKSTARIRGTTRQIDVVARDLRRRMTPAEQELWRALRGHGLAGLQFRRQHPLGPFVVDFYCAAHRLVIEVDGEVHAEQAGYDAARTQRLREFGYRVLRFTNDEVMESLPSVLDRILQAVGELR